MKVILPRPPGVNSIYKYTNRGGYARSYISSEGIAWFTESTYLIKAKTQKRDYDGDLSLYVIFKCCGLGDSDGILKPTLDVFEKAGIIKNDRQFSFIQVQREKVKTRKEEGLEVEVPEL